MPYTVKQLADLAGVSVRTLHYYDEIGLLEPARDAANGYRTYGDDALFRLQQILLYREMGLSLKDIGAVLDAPGFDVRAALRDHRAGLVARIGRLRGLIATVDSTLRYLDGEGDMSNKQLFEGFSDEDIARYRQEATEAWGAEAVDPSYARWESYTPEQREMIMAEGQAIYRDLVALMDRGPASPEVQHVLARWHRHLRYFYEPSVARLRGLGALYVEHPDFAANFRAMHPDLPEFMQEAIGVYCDGLESSAE
jgi:DNA-binding transcriptional MerR regulator